jgi:hypothetical protein
MSPMAPRTGSSIMKSMRAATVVARLINTCGVSPALDAPGCVEVLAAAPRARRAPSSCQMTPMARRHAHTIYATDPYLYAVGRGGCHHEGRSSTSTDTTHFTHQ